ncbi:uracil-DNA glycosylase family protein [Konateibacter massiliensis]|uniref:uracil-DNA glycosylase family protein n=1 Tax=Konateibacter massiliensis TaxID=2002841 RepID=UPI000C159518|nr:uracil-DNA glycosylase family protein [Konateibacter massiliensis]
MNKQAENKGDNKTKLGELHSQIAQCRLCEVDFGYTPRPIIQGHHNAKIMQISQAPSKSVHEAGKPFHDASGKKLRGEWYQISDEDFYNPDNFYIVSMAHCYPGKAPGGGDRRPPKICSKEWLSKEMELVENEIYIIIGSYAAEYFFPGEKITALAFQDRQINGKPAYILPHPSPLNVKWFKDYPEFTTQRIVKIREDVHRVLEITK